MKPERYKQIEELYHWVLGRKPEERAAFLDQSCGVDEALRREVESLLGYDERAKQFIETPPDDVAAAMLAAEQKQSMVGRTLGHYRVVSLLGARRCEGEIGWILLLLPARTAAAARDSTRDDTAGL